MKSYKRTVIYDTLISIAILVITFFLSLILNNLFQLNSLVQSLFVLAVFLIALVTNGYMYGLISALICVLADNYAFAFPRSFLFSLSGYLL